MLTRNRREIRYRTFDQRLTNVLFFALGVIAALVAVALGL